MLSYWIFIANRLHASNTVFSCLPLFPVLVSAKTTTSNDRNGCMTASMQVEVAATLVVTQSVI